MPNRPRFTSRTRLSIAVVFALFIVGFALKSSVATMAPAPVPGTSSTIFINEIHYDNTGTDTGEFVEVAGPAGTDLTGWRIELYNGSGGARYDTDALSGVIPSQQGGYGTVSLTYPTDGIQNGSPDGIALISPANTVVQFLCYEGSFTATSSTALGQTCTDIGISEVGTTPVGQSLQLQGTGTTAGNFTWAGPITNTKDNPNTGQTFGGGVSLFINNATVTEGNSGSVTASFTVSVSSTLHSGVTFDIATADNTATTADSDYVAKALTGQSIPAGQSSYTFDVTVNGDTNFESDETFFVNVSNVTGATVGDGQGQGTITNDDCPVVAGDVVISQVYGGGGNAGATFTHDFIELFNQGSTPVNLSGWSVQYASSTGSTWQVTPLSGTIAPGAYYLIQEAAGAGGTTPLPTPDATGAIPMAGGAGKVALLATTTPLSGTCPTCAVDFVGYGGANCFEGAGPTAATSNTTAALRKRSGCFDSNSNNVDFSIGSPNPRNSSSPTNDCQPLSLAIHDIQGPGLTTPYNGKFVSTTGIVTALKTNGFFMQEPEASVDTDSNTSEGIFVFTSSAPAVVVGDAVSVLGTATEFFNLTQLESSLPGDVAVNSSGNTLPAAINLTPAILDPEGTPVQLEKVESMRLHADTLVSVAPTNEFAETVTVLNGVARPMREPGIEISLTVPPDPTLGVPDCCIPRWDENPERIMIDSDGLVGSLVISVTSNVTLSNVTGPLDFTFGNYKILPETAPTTSANMSAVPVPTPLPGEFTVAGYNIENFNNNATQRQKAALAVRDVLHLPDIIGVIEIFDLADLQALAAEIQSISGVVYSAHLVEADGTSEDADQDVGFLVKTSRVQVDSVTQEELAGCDGEPENCNTFTDPNTLQPALLNDRPPLVLRATVDPSGVNPVPVIVVVNHLRSFIDIEGLGNEGKRVREKRKVQAEFLADLIQDLQTANPNKAVMSIGDYNAYQFNDGYTDPVATIKGNPTPDNEVVVDESPDLVNPNFINLTDGLPADQRYSFIFEGTPQAIDHMLINTVAQSMFQRYAIARNNSDFPEVPGSLFHDDASRPESNSDHDMPVAYFKASADLSLTKTASPEPVVTGTNVTYTITVTNNGALPAVGVVVTDNLPTETTFVSCNAGVDGVCSGAGNNRSITFPAIPAGQNRVITLVATVSCSLSDGAAFSNTASLTATTNDPNSSNNSQTANSTASNPAPVITGVSVDIPVLSPPNHKMVDVTVNYGATDNCGSPSCVLTVSSNEPVDGDGDGNTAPDWLVIDDHHVKLRAERSGYGTGRIYTITITCTDNVGRTSTQTVTVEVPLN